MRQGCAGLNFALPPMTALFRSADTCRDSQNARGWFS
jgi:hypothetical protein